MKVIEDWQHCHHVSQLLPRHLVFSSSEQCKVSLTELKQMIYFIAMLIYNSLQQNLSLKIIESYFLSKVVVELSAWIATGHFIRR